MVRYSQDVGVTAVLAITIITVGVVKVIFFQQESNIDCDLA
jgi:hypothetical protein